VEPRAGLRRSGQPEPGRAGDRAGLVLVHAPHQRRGPRAGLPHRRQDCGVDPSPVPLIAATVNIDLYSTTLG
jgi:hypothetical protein